MQLLRTPSVRVRASATEPSKLAAFRKKVEAKRTITLKENLNKITTVATADMKFVSDTLKELDAIHKSMFEKYTKSSPTTTDTMESMTEEESTNENIFLEKKP